MDSSEKIVFYTTHCPHCELLKSELDKKHIAYKTVTDVDVMLAKGFEWSPVLEVNGKVLQFKEALTYVRSR
jgi:glutaredoxin